MGLSLNKCGTFKRLLDHYLTSYTVTDSQFYGIKSLELVSFNARGLGNEKKRKKVFNILKKQTSMNSVIFLQECHSAKEVERLWEYQ